MASTDKWPANSTARRSVASLIPYARNARIHAAEQVAQIAASITEWGWTTPVLIDGDDGIIAGHGRILAAQLLGIADIPVIVASGWTEAQKRAYIIADNQLTINGAWDEDLLRVELDDLRSSDFDIDLLGFSGDMFPPGVGEEGEVEFPILDSGERDQFQSMTFTFHDEQAENILAALKLAKDAGPFTGSPNENSNGNAVDRICADYRKRHG